MNIPHPVLLGIFLVFVAIGAVMHIWFDIEVGPTMLSTILIVIGVISLIIWFILVVYGHIKAA